MANVPVITEPDWDGKTPYSRSEAILLSIINGTPIDTEKWEGIPLSRGEYLLIQLKDVIEDNSMFDIKGRVDSVEDLPATGNKKGDVYSVGPEDQLNKPEYYWNGDFWDYLGQLVDLSGYLPLTGGTMTGPLVFNFGGKNFEIKTYDNQVYVMSSNSSIHLEAQVDVVAKASNSIVANVGSGTATYDGTDLTVNNVAILSTLSSIQTTIGNINTVLEEVL